VKIELLDHCASDLAVVNAARVSFAEHHDVMKLGDDKLISFLMRNRHGTPFEHGYFRFRVEAPIFVFREWHRHRIGHSYNEMSGRYTKLEQKFYVPSVARKQVGKPGAYSYEECPDLTEFLSENVQRVYRLAWYTYEQLLAEGIAKEQARIVLPVGLYSQMYWSCNPRSLMHFLGLRHKPDAMQEIRSLAAKAHNAFARSMPTTAVAFRDNGSVAP
jgi:thymidylate synthase (FAD)